MLFFFSSARKYTCLLLGSILLCSSSPLLGSAQDLVLLKRVREYWKDGDYSLAKKQIRDYLEQSPEGEIQQELHLLLGDLYLREGNPLAALDEYNQIKKDSLNEKSFYNKALCLYETKNLEQLASHLEQMEDLPHLTSKERHSLSCLYAAILLESKEEQNLVKAQSLLESCQGKELSAPSLALLAQIFLLRGEQEKAANYYLLLGEKDPSQAPKLWAKAAILFADTDPTKALSLTEKTLSLSSIQDKSTLTYNLLVLQYRLGLFKEVINSYESKQQHLSSEQKLLSLHLLGKSLYHLKEYATAAEHLQLFAKQGNPSPEQSRELYLQILSCAHNTKNLSLYEEVLPKALSFLSSDPLASKVQYGYLELLRFYDEKEKLISTAEAFLQQYGKHPQKEEILRNLVYALYETKNWQKAEDSILSCLQLSPSSDIVAHLKRLQLNCASLAFQNSTKENSSHYLSHLIALQQVALTSPDLLSFGERELLLPQLANNLFLADRFGDTLEVINLFAAEHPHTELSQELQLLQALCYLQDPESTHLFVIQAEKLLQNDPSNENLSSLRTHLFNTYVQLSKKATVPSKTECLQKAADLLYATFTEKKQLIQPQNIHWLAEHYYQQANSQELVATRRSIDLFEHLLEGKQETKELALYRLSELLSYTGELEKKAALLEHWTQKEPQSRIQKHLLLELASSYNELGEQEKALALYDTLTHSTATSHVDLEALIQKCKIVFSRIKPEEKTEDNPSCLEILNHLKDVENERNLASEPLHIEAGLTYIECRVSLIKDPEKAKLKQKELLQGLLENIHLYSIDPSSPQYFLIEAYKTYINDALALNEEDIATIQLLHQSLKELQFHPLTPKFLQKRIQQNIQL